MQAISESDLDRRTRTGSYTIKSLLYISRALFSAIFFSFLTLFKIIFKYDIFNFFFKTNTFERACSHGAAKSRCRAMHEVRQEWRRCSDQSR